MQTFGLLFLLGLVGFGLGCDSDSGPGAEEAAAGAGGDGGQGGVQAPPHCDEVCQRMIECVGAVNPAVLEQCLAACERATEEARRCVADAPECEQAVTCIDIGLD